VKPAALILLATLAFAIGAAPTLAHPGHEHIVKERPEHEERSPAPSSSPSSPSSLVLESRVVGLTHVLVTLLPAATGTNAHLVVQLVSTDESGAMPTVVRPRIAVVTEHGEISWPELVSSEEGYVAELVMPTAGRYELRLYTTAIADETPLQVFYVRP
jgi:hypothetical protein